MRAARLTADDPVAALCVAIAESLGLSAIGILLTTTDAVRCIGVSNDAAATVEQVESDLGEGPCVDASRNNQPVLAPDLADPALPWPGFARGANAAGINAAFGFPMSAGGRCIGAVNLYRDRSGPLSDDQYANALVVARVAASCVTEWQAAATPGTLAWQLDDVRNLRVAVHQAAGRVSIQANVTVRDALSMLRAHAFTRDRSLDEVAADVATGRLRFHHPEGVDPD